MFAMYYANKPLAPSTSSRRDSSPPPPPPISKYAPEEDNIQASIDGPPSPTRIRAYTEQMRLHSAFAPHTRMYKRDQSIASSMRSGSSSGSEFPKLSRTSSKSSTSKKSSKGERPESVLNFGKTLFSRSKKSKRDLTGQRSSSSLSNHVQTIEEHPQISAKERYYANGNEKRPRRGTLSDSVSTDDENAPPKLSISGPFNFQHVTHTRQEHLPNLHRTSRMELVSEFSALRASQAPTHGQLKEIRAHDLHFENFSSENLDADADSPEKRPKTGHQRSRQNTPTKSISHQPIRGLKHAQSHDSLRISPPRPPRTPSEHQLPIVPPPRTSSRTASVLWESFDSVAAGAFNRPQTAAPGPSRPKAFHLPISPPVPMKHSTDEYFFESTPQDQRTPESESWPLSLGLESPSPSQQLADVPEEDETSAKRKSKASRASLRYSRSVPDIRNSQQFLEETLASPPELIVERRPSTPTTVSTMRQSGNLDNPTDIGVALSPTKEPVKIASESWEDDIDYAYEHEVEADCDYDWDRCSFDEREETSQKSVSTSDERPPRFRPSLLVPSANDLPSLSPTSSLASTLTPTSAQNPLTPGGPVHRPTHLRSPSQASSFKESHGFTLSPSLLIPTDYINAMSNLSDSDNNINAYSSDVAFAVPLSPTFNSRSSTTSSSTSTYRSSAFSRSSHTSHASHNTSLSSSTAALPKSHSQESIPTLLHRKTASNPALSLSSISSSSSLPDLLKHTQSRHQYIHLDAPENGDLAAPSPGVPYTQNRRRTNSSARSTPTSHPTSFSQPFQVSGIPGADAGNIPALSPVQEIVSKVMAGERHPAVEKFEKDHIMKVERAASKHGRQGSAPLLNMIGREMEPERPKTSGGRKRSSSAAVSKGGKAGGYALFPQI